MIIYFVSDFFKEEYLGGAEICDDEIIRLLQEKGHNVVKKKSNLFQIEECKNENIIFSNFTKLSDDIKDRVSKLKNYIIIEHDHKYLNLRNPVNYEFFLSPEEEIVNFEFYKNAKAVICQSKKHSQVIQQNLLLKNIINLGFNFWSEEQINLIKNKKSQKKKYKYGILASKNFIKGYEESLKFCKEKNIEPFIIFESDFEEYIDNLSKIEKLIFFPQVLESFSRVFLEAKMLGCSVITNNLVGALSEEWIKEDPLEYLQNNKNKKIEIIENALSGENISFYNGLNSFSIVTNTYNVEQSVNRTISSALMQNYPEFKLYLTDDNSSDGTINEIKKYLSNDRLTFVKNQQRQGQMKNLYDKIKILDKNDILVFLDGDDELIDPGVLRYLNAVYNQSNCLLTYGSYYEKSSKQIGKFSKKYDGNEFRNAPWQFSHLKTMRKEVWEKIPVEEFKDNNGNFFSVSSDLAFMLPALEISHPRISFIEKPLYVYNNLNPINDHKTNNALQIENESFIRNRKKI